MRTPAEKGMLPAQGSGLQPATSSGPKDAVQPGCQQEAAKRRICSVEKPPDSCHS